MSRQEKTINTAPWSRRFEMDRIQLNVTVQQAKELFSKIIKESTNFLSQDFEKRNNCMKMKLFQDIDDALKMEISSFKLHCMETDSDTRNYLSEIKTVLNKIETTLDGDSSNSKKMKDKIDSISQSISKTHQKLEENSALIEKRMENFKNIEVKRESSTGSDSKLFLSALDENEFHSFRGSQTSQSVISTIKANTGKSNNATLYFSPKNEVMNKSDLDNEFQGSFRRRKSIMKFRNKSRSKLTWINSVNSMISSLDWTGKRKLVDVEEMHEILFETTPHLKSNWNQNSNEIKKKRKILNESSVSTIY